MSKPDKHTGLGVRCLRCDEQLDFGEFSAARVESPGDGTCVVTCSHCDADNEVRARPSGGFDEQPVAVAVRLVSRDDGHGQRQ